VKIFISYRRADSQYLAQIVCDGLHERIPGSTVFFDLQSVPPGNDFESRIVREIEAAAVLIALLGPNWQPDRLHRDDDYVRQEILAAERLGKRVVPVLHSGQATPRVAELPPELAWLPQRNAFALTSAATLDDDLRRLATLLTDGVPALKDLRDRAWAHYEHKEDDELLTVADQTWAEHGASPSPGLADVCRTAALALTRGDRLNERNVWLARAMSTAFLSGASNVFAASMLPLFFQLAAAGHLEGARQVLVEIARLTDLDDAAQLPPGPMMRRLYHEKLGYTLYVDGAYADAEREYQLAIATAGGDARGVEKSRAAMALCAYRQGRRQEAITATEDVQRCATLAGWNDVADTAATNLEAMRRGDEALVPYEVL